MIEEQFVSFDTAKLLKEAGFYEVCRCDYDGLNRFRWFRIRESVPKGWLPCPSQDLAARWLREKHYLHVWCELTQYGDWFYCIDKIKPYEQYDVVSEADFSSFEKAFEAGLQEAIKLIKK